MEQYRDPYNFEPLEPALDAVMLRIADGCPDHLEYNEGVKVKEDGAACRELHDKGYLLLLSSYIDGVRLVAPTEKGRRYPQDKAEWQARYDEWKAERESEKKLDKRHEWGMSAVGWIVAVATATIGFIVGKLT